MTGGIERAHPALGTLVAIRAHAATPEAAERALSAGCAAIDAVHRAMSFHAPDSGLSCLNRQAVAGPCEVDAGLWRVLCAALALARASGGRFDPTIAARLVASGHLPAPDAPVPPPGAEWRDVELLPGRCVRFRRPLWLDLGGIAKGHAVDRAVAAMRRSGATRGVVNAGGDLRAFGDVFEPVQVRDPAEPARPLQLLELREGAVATSAGYFSGPDGNTALVDPHDGRRLGHGVSVTVCAPRALWADALTKVVLADAGQCAPLLRRLRAQAVVLGTDGSRRILS